MPQTDKRQFNRRLVWCLPPVALVCAALGNFLGEMIFIFAVYGREAYFQRGLRIVKHKPFTLSTGIVLSNNLSFLCWLIDAVLWLVLIFLSMWILTGLVSMFPRRIQADRNQEHNDD